MSIRHLLFFAACVAAGSLGAQDQIKSLPAAVQRTIEIQAKGDPVKSVFPRTEGGRTVYEVEIERNNAINPRFRIDQDGTVLPTPYPTVTDPVLTGSPVPVAEVLTLDSLPAAVQQTVRAQAAGRQIVDIDRRNWQGRTVYDVEFRAEGRNPQIHVAEDGTLVQPERARDRLSERFRGTQLADTPAVVQETIRKEAAGRPINNIDVERRSSDVVYKVEIRDPQSGNFQLHVDANGQILKDSRVTAPQSRP
jgi:uncharacterized membrane protein YkoI